MIKNVSCVYETVNRLLKICYQIFFPLQGYSYNFAKATPYIGKGLIFIFFYFLLTFTRNTFFTE